MATETIETLLNQLGDRPEAIARLARVLLAKGLNEQAYQLCARAVAAAPLSAEVHALTAEVLGYSVPGWFFNLVKDHTRHLAYENAMRRTISAGDLVLEIGTGTGLFAMLAARLGAAKVITCEKNPIVASVASEIIARNGFSDCISVIAKDSKDLKLGSDFERPVDVVICDALSNNMIGAGVLPTMEHAMHQLARPGARVIPATGVIHVALAEHPWANRKMNIVEGFDLSPFNKLARPCFSVHAGDEQLTLRSPPADLFSFEFQSGGPFPESRTTRTLKASGGRVSGIAQWNYFQIDEQGYYEGRPEIGAISAFEVLFFPLIEPLDLRPGETIEVCASQNRQSLSIWAVSS